jgi:DNA primase
MRYKGRIIDPVKLWGEYVELPSRIDEDTFLPKTHCPNPAHNTEKKHFQVNRDQATVHCFAYCGISGSYAHALCIIHGYYDQLGVDVDLAKSSLGKKPRQRTPKEKSNLALWFRAHRKADKIIFKHPGVKNSRDSRVRKRSANSQRTTPVIRPSELRYESFLPKEGMEFLESRGISGSAIAKWGIGWSTTDARIVIPAEDERGRIRFLIKRAVKPHDWPKYLYTEGFPKTSLLFGACRIDPGMVRSHGIALVEGAFDTIVLDSFGIVPVGGILGTGISDQQVAIIAKLRPKRIYHFFDRDTAGISNIQIAAKKLRKYPQFVCRYPKGKYDPAELVAPEAQRSIERAIPLFKFTHRLNVNTKEREKSFG